jgi:hypothetical protein
MRGRNGEPGWGKNTPEARRTEVPYSCGNFLQVHVHFQVGYFSPGDCGESHPKEGLDCFARWLGEPGV